MNSPVKKPKKTCDLHSCLLCRTSLDAWLPAVEAHRKNFNFKKGEMIFREGDPVHGLFFIYSGAVKVHKKWGPDKELIIRFARKGDLFGHRGLGDPGSSLLYPVSATAMEALTVCFIGLDFFQSSLAVNPAFTRAILDFYSAELHESERKMTDLAHMSVRGRIARALLQLQDKFGLAEDGSIDLTLSRQDLASFVGATYETIFRVLNELAKEEIIRFSGKEISILQPAVLADQVSAEKR